MNSNEEFLDFTDEELAKKALVDQGVFVYIIKRYEDKLMSYILRLSNIGYEDAEDVLQDVFIKVYQNLNDFDPDLKFSSWIYRITHNQVISNFRKLKARPQSIAMDLEDDVLNRLASDLDIEREVNLKILRDNIYRVLNQMDVKYKEILILKFFEEKNYKEMSDILKKPMGTIATLVNRAKTNFCKELEKQQINFK